MNKEAATDRLLKLRKRRGEFGKPETVERTLKENPQPKPDFDNSFYTQKKAEMAFVRGFTKQATSRLGTYFSSAIPSREMAANHPYLTSAALSVPYGGAGFNPLGAPAAFELMAGLIPGKEDPFKKLNDDGYGETFLRRGKAGFKMGLIPAGLLASLGAAGALDLGSGALKDAAPGLLAGAAALPIATGLFGSGVGLYDKFVANHTDVGSQQAARKMKSDHPFLTALPFGDAIGSIVYGGKGKKKIAHVEKKAELAFIRGFVKAASFLPQPPEALGLLTDNSSQYETLLGKSLADTLSSGLIGAGLGGVGGASLGYLSGRKEGKGGRRALLGGLLGAGVGGLGGAGYAANEGVKALSSKYVEDADKDISRLQDELGPKSFSLFGHKIPLGFAASDVADFEAKLSPDRMSEPRYNVGLLREKVKNLTRDRDMLNGSNLLNILPRLAVLADSAAR